MKYQIIMGWYAFDGYSEETGLPRWVQPASCGTMFSSREEAENERVKIASKIDKTEVRESPGEPSVVKLGDATMKREEREMLESAAWDLLEVCRRILVRCELGSGMRHSYADGKGTLSGCTMTADDIEAARKAVMKATGHDELPIQIPRSKS